MDGIEPDFVAHTPTHDSASVARRRDRGERARGEIEDSGFWKVVAPATSTGAISRGAAHVLPAPLGCGPGAAPGTAG